MRGDASPFSGRQAVDRRSLMSANLAPGLCDGVFLVDCVREEFLLLNFAAADHVLAAVWIGDGFGSLHPIFVHDRTMHHVIAGMTRLPP